MKAAVYYNNQDIRIEEMAVPKISSKEILVRVKACGVCGSDVMEWYRIKKAPLILGHEIAGEIEEVGKEVKGYKKGERVIIAHHVPCNKCYYCLSGHHTVCETLRKTNIDPGGFAEYVRVPEINVNYGIFLMPDTLSYEEGCFVEPLACVVRAQRVAGLRIGGSVLVLGSGIAGLLHIQLARIIGSTNIVAIDVSEYRLKAAKELGASYTLLAEQLTPDVAKEINKGRLFDTVILSTGAVQAIETMFNYVERGGTLLIFAPSPPDYHLKINFNELFWRNELKIVSSYAGAPYDYNVALELIASKRIDVQFMITHKLPLEKIKLAFELVAKAKESIKVIIENIK